MKNAFASTISPPSAARLSQKGILPVKVKEGNTIKNCLDQLLETIKISPPPWLKKILNKEEDNL